MGFDLLVAFGLICIPLAGAWLTAKERHERGQALHNRRKTDL